MAILIEDRKTRGPDGRPGFYPTTGILITRDWVLTVRHGFTKFRGKRYVPRLSVGATEGGKRVSLAISADRIFIHPTLDLALVRVEGWNPPFSFRPARLAPPPPISEQVLLAGFGQTKDAPAGTSLRAVEEPVSAPAVVDSSRLPDLFPPHLAAHYMEIDQRDGKGSCSGDSGGPVFRRVEDQLELVGIIAGNASFDGRHPCLEYSYAVRIDGAVDWIAAVTGKSFNLLTRAFQD
ncbi:MAG: trypsin-like serine protease [Rhodocyclaceae bacterium]